MQEKSAAVYLLIYGTEAYCLSFFVDFVGSIPLPIFSEWWLAMEKFSEINSFILSSFSGATFHGCNGLSMKYQVWPIVTSWISEHYLYKSITFFYLLDKIRSQIGDFWTIISNCAYPNLNLRVSLIPKPLQVSRGQALGRR